MLTHLAVHLQLRKSLLEVGGHAGEEGVGAPGVASVSDYDGPDSRRGEDFKPGSGSLEEGEHMHIMQEYFTWWWVIRITLVML